MSKVNYISLLSLNLSGERLWLAALLLLLFLFYLLFISSLNKSLIEELAQQDDKAFSGKNWARIGFFIEDDEDKNGIGFFAES